MFNHKFLILISSITIIASCETGEKIESGSVVVHPIEKNIPYSDRDHIIIDTDELDDDEVLPDKLSDLFMYLHDTPNFEKRPLNTHVSGVSDVDISSIDSSRVVVLDEFSNGFFLYDLTTHSTIPLAQAGRGPGDIAYPQEMVVYDDEIFIAREDMKISKFVCHQQHCEYETTIPLEYSAVSLAKAENSFAVLGQMVLRENSDPEINKKAIRIIDKNGTTLESFGLFYQTEHRIVLFSLRGGMIRYNENQKKYILAFKHLPFLYIFDEERNIDQVFKFEKYLQGEIKYYSEMNASGPPANDRTTINRVEIFEDPYLFIGTTTRYKNDESVTDHIYEQDYYALNLEKNESHYIGGESSELNTLIYPLQKNFIRNEDGELYYVELNR